MEEDESTAGNVPGRLGLALQMEAMHEVHERVRQLHITHPTVQRYEEHYCKATYPKPCTGGHFAIGGNGHPTYLGKFVPSESSIAAEKAHEEAMARETRYAEAQVKVVRDKFTFPPLTREREDALRSFLRATETMDVKNKELGGAHTCFEDYDTFLVRLELNELTADDLRNLGHWNAEIDSQLQRQARSKARSDYENALKEFESLPKAQLVDIPLTAAVTMYRKNVVLDG